MDQQTLITFLALVFGTVFLLSQIIVVPTFGTERQERKRLRKRLEQVAADSTAAQRSLVRERYLKTLSPIEQWLDSLPGMASVNRLIEQTGGLYPGYRLVVTSLVLGMGIGGGLFAVTNHPVAAGTGFLVAAASPTVRLKRARQRRLDLFEQQLPEALDLMVRALRAGHPFNVAMSFISREMSGPVAEEFGLTFDEITYGRDVNRAFLYLLDRVPSMSLMAMATAVFIQRETGGNLAEILDKISAVLRSRFRFHRRVRTLTAEGRISAWVLALLPFVLFLALTFLNPDYLGSLTGSETGKQLAVTGLVLLVIGIIWMNRLIHIRV